MTGLESRAHASSYASDTAAGRDAPRDAEPRPRGGDEVGKIK